LGGVHPHRPTVERGERLFVVVVFEAAAFPSRWQNYGKLGHTGILAISVKKSSGEDRRRIEALVFPQTSIVSSLQMTDKPVERAWIETTQS
jgi:hypothetical protein